MFIFLERRQQNWKSSLSVFEIVFLYFYAALSVNPIENWITQFILDLSESKLEGMECWQQAVIFTLLPVDRNAQKHLLSCWWLVQSTGTVLCNYSLPHAACDECRWTRIKLTGISVKLVCGLIDKTNSHNRAWFLRDDCGNARRPYRDVLFFSHAYCSILKNVDWCNKHSFMPLFN